MIEFFVDHLDQRLHVAFRPEFIVVVTKLQFHQRVLRQFVLDELEFILLIMSALSSGDQVFDSSHVRFVQNFRRSIFLRPVSTIGDYEICQDISIEGIG